MLIVLIVLGVSCATLLEVARADRARMQWLRDVFEHRDPAFGVLSLDETRANDLPLVVGGLVPATVVTHVSQLGTNRSSASVRYGVAAFTFEATVRPLARRMRLAAGLTSGSSLCAVLGASAR